MSMEILQEKIRKKKNPALLCLDPTGDVIPPHLLEEAIREKGQTLEALALACENYCRGILEAVSDSMPGVSVKTAGFFALGPAGAAVLERILAYAREKELYVILDGAFGEPGFAGQALAESIFGGIPVGDQVLTAYPADGVTVNPYAGADGAAAFLPYCRTEGKSLFVQVRTANRSSVEVQELLTGGRLVYTAVADLASRWGAELCGRSGYSQVGAVVSASRGEVLKTLREKYDRLFLLVTGLGVQGGCVKNASYAFDRLGRGAAVCAGHSILGAWKKAETDGRDYAAQAAAAAEKLKRDLSKYVLVM